MFKKSISLMICLSMFFSLTVYSFATPKEVDVLSSETVEFTKSDVLSLQKYVSLNKDGTFNFNVIEAQKDGVHIDLINAQLEYFKEINPMISSGQLSTSADLEITNNEALVRESFTHDSNCGGGVLSATEYYWWGHTKYFCDCEANDYAIALAGAVAGAEAAAIMCNFWNLPGTLVFGMSGAYWTLLSSRIFANNDGKGVYIEMTYIGAFDVTPQ